MSLEKFVVGAVVLVLLYAVTAITTCTMHEQGEATERCKLAPQNCKIDTFSR